MKLEPFAARPPVATAWRNIHDGFLYVAHTRAIRWLLAMLAILSFAGLPYTVLMPLVADGILHRGSQGFGVLMGSIGLGAMCGALLLAARSGITGLSRWLVVASGVFSVSLACFAWSRSLPLSCGLLLVTGFAMMIQVAATNTLIQSMVPDHYRGRVMSVYSMMLIGMSPLGAMAAGFEAEHLGAPITLTLGAAVCLVSAIVFAAKLEAFRQSARELLADRQVHAASSASPAKLNKGR
jgi:MFS family permease